eukprot:365409-Chlamydomonas_euryale.AAC.3
MHAMCGAGGLSFNQIGAASPLAKSIIGGIHSVQYFRSACRCTMHEQPSAFAAAERMLPSKTFAAHVPRCMLKRQSVCQLCFGPHASTLACMLSTL